MLSPEVPLTEYISLVTCPQGVYPQPPSCNNTELEMCSGSLCVDLVYMQLGRQASFTCVEVNCKQQDRMCNKSQGEKCIPVSLPPMYIDSVYTCVCRLHYTV